ncbi:MAG: transcription-repair coupling factor [Rickettsiaceae bacterium]|nr:MAG: transcription-repair coupling factor [Rickettsiaceae bacterium]
MKINIPHKAKAFLAYRHLINSARNILLVCHSEEETYACYQQSLFLKKNNIKSYYLPSVDTSPYDRLSPSSNLLMSRSETLNALANKKQDAKVLLVTNAINLLTKLPPVESFFGSTLSLQKNMKISINELLSFLIENGFHRNSTAVDNGEFAIKGEIVDIVLKENEAFRINFRWDNIESIKRYDPSSQISTIEESNITIGRASEIVLNNLTTENFRKNYLTTFGVNFVNQPIYESIINRRNFPGFEHLISLFYNHLSSITDYISDLTVIYDDLSLQSMQEYQHTCINLFNSRLKVNNNKLLEEDFYPLLSYDRTYYQYEYIEQQLKSNDNLMITALAEDEKSSYTDISNISINAEKGNELSHFDAIFQLIDDNAGKYIIIFCSTTTGYEKLKSIIVFNNRKFSEITDICAADTEVINLAKVRFNGEFCADNYLFLSEQTFFGDRHRNSGSNYSSKRRLKNILTELDSLQPEELVIHKDHGLGKFVAIETIDVGGKPHDCLKIIYANNDRLYVPVENIDLVKKYGSLEGELDKLGGVSWQRRKSKTKSRIAEIASDLLRIAAVRQLATCTPIEYELSQYDKFCARFNYFETEDQLKAVEEIKKDLGSGKLMDRLICGDVGFGKTEIAMRASFMVAANIEDKSQVAIIVPTTILCKQHYTRFLERFEGFNFNIVQLSRLISKKAIVQTKEQIKTGAADIIIGTHALLANNIEFFNLKLLVIDEEQHFGVSQKELLKKIKSKVHVLSLSATPIPRTLQMSLVGLKELSLVATPPVDRMAIRTMIMPFDATIIRDALLKEYLRGGKSFYVCPRIKDISEVEIILTKIVPELKIKIAHGQMLASKVEEIMTDFYQGKFDILLSTTIIESGIDIATANTIIIHKADQLGLSQLYQLRGRVGRSSIRGYAYLTLSADRKIKKDAIKRLEIMQNVDSLGAGFTIASHDMDLRGFGNLVGAEQSGQIKEVGAELYQEMLDEQIALYKDDKSVMDTNFVPIINLGLSVFISDSYITDTSLRLGIYRRIGNLVDLEEVQKFTDEMNDRFGPIPQEFANLLEIVKVKQICQMLKIRHLDSGSGGFVLKFCSSADMSQGLLQFVHQNSQNVKIKPDNKLIYLTNLTSDNIIGAVGHLLNQLLISVNS